MDPDDIDNMTGETAEARVLEALGVDMIDESDEELVPDSKILISGIDELKLMESNLAKPHKLPG